mgnify:CR=1 FL=1
MPRPRLPREVYYVQKLHYLTFLCSITILATCIVLIAFGKYAGFCLCLGGILLSYIATLKKTHFISPNDAAVIHSLVQNFKTRNLPPFSAAVAATQMFYLLGDTRRSEALLKSYLPCEEPLVYTTLADMYLNQGKIREALSCLDPVRKLEHPLIQWTFGRIFLQQEDYATALKYLERAYKIVRKDGFPKANTGLLTSTFMQWSVKASLFHSMAECYHKAGDIKSARKFLRRGNLYLIDPSLWLNSFSLTGL